GSVDSSRSAGRAQLWELDTPAAVVAIRGTSFALTFSHDAGARLGVFHGNVELQQAESAEGPGQVLSIGAHEEAVATRRKPLRKLKEFDAFMKDRYDGRAKLEHRHQEILGTWTSYTPSIRTGLRKKFVAPPPKRIRRPPPPRQRRATKIRNSY